MRNGAKRRLAADWLRQERFWMAWPAPSGRWGEHLAPARQAVVEAAEALAELAPVTMLANPAEAVEISLHCGPGIGALSMTHLDCCMRMIGPSFLVDDQGALSGGLVWGGGMEDARFGDGRIAADILDHLAQPAIPGLPGWTGGAIESDGAGCVLLAETGRSSHEMRALLGELGVERVVPLRCDLEGDMAGGGCLANTARFLRPGLVALHMEDDPASHDYSVGQLNHNRLTEAGLAVLPLPRPKRRHRPDGSRLLLSYANCFVSADLVMAPAFDDNRDETARQLVENALNSPTVISLPAFDLAYCGGGLGSMVLPQPARA